MTLESRPRADAMSHRPERSVWYAGRLLTVLATAEETDGRFSLVEERVGKSGVLALPACIHTREWLYSYVIAGELAIQVGEDESQVTSGAHVAIPPGVLHRFDIASESVHLLHIYSPGGFDGFFRDIGEPADNLAHATLAAAALDIERLVGFAAKYGVHIVSPECDPT